jgi:hypothetical protein
MGSALTRSAFDDSLELAGVLDCAAAETLGPYGVGPDGVGEVRSIAVRLRLASQRNRPRGRAEPSEFGEVLLLDHVVRRAPAPEKAVHLGSVLELRVVGRPQVEEPLERPTHEPTVAIVVRVPRRVTTHALLEVG